MTSGVSTNPETQSPEEGNTALAHPSTPTHSADGSVSPPGPQLYLPHSLPPNHPDLATNPPTASCVKNYATQLDPTSSLGPNYIGESPLSARKILSTKLCIETGNQPWSSFDISDAPWADPAALEALAREMDPSRPATGCFLPNTPSSSNLIQDPGHTLNEYANNPVGGMNPANTLNHTSNLRLHPAAFHQANIVSHPDPASASPGLSGTHVGNVTIPTSSFEPIPWSNMASFPQEHLAPTQPAATVQASATTQPAVPTTQSTATTDHPWATTAQATGTVNQPTSTTSSTASTAIETGTTTSQPIEETTQPAVPVQPTPLQQTPPAQPPVSPIPPASLILPSPEPPTQAPPPPGQTAITLTQSSLPAAPAREPLAAAHTDIRRSTRSTVPTTRLDQLNAIGTNPTPPKPSTPDITVPPPWFDPAVKYLSSRSDLGPQFLSVVEKWRGLEVQARYGGKSSKVRV